MQIDSEMAANTNLRESLEKTYRLIHDQLENKF